MLWEFLADVSRKGMSFSLANCFPRSEVISRSVRSLLLPISMRVTVLPAYLSTSASHSGRFLKVPADPMS